MTEPDALTANPFQPHAAPDTQPIRQGDNTREFQVKWHAVQLAKSYLAFLPAGTRREDIDATRIVEVANRFALASKFTHEERTTFIQSVIATLAAHGT